MSIASLIAAWREEADEIDRVHLPRITTHGKMRQLERIRDTLLRCADELEAAEWTVQPALFDVPTGAFL